MGYPQNKGGGNARDAIERNELAFALDKVTAAAAHLFRNVVGEIKGEYHRPATERERCLRHADRCGPRLRLAASPSMPHTGKPSGACQQCKKSHVKCDEARPACGRCVRANRVCSGYSEGLDLVLRDQNESVKAQVGRRQKKVSKSKSKGSTPERQFAPRSPASVIISPPAESEETHALSFFVSTFVLFPRDTQADRGFLEHLPHLFANLRVGSPLSLALTASSRASYSKWERRRKDVETLSFPDYGVALKATRVALQDPVECMSDETLMAVCLLGFYEASTSAFAARISPARHFNGAAALLKQRRMRGQITELSKKLLTAVRSNILFRATQFSSPIDETSGLWDDYDGMSQNPATLLDAMFVEVATLLAHADRPSALVADLDSDEIELFPDGSSLVVQAEEVDARLASWPNHVPASWFPIQITADSVQKSVIDASFYGDSCDIYPDIIICSTWNEWRVARLKVLSLIASAGNNASRYQAIRTIQRLMDRICASVPFSLGDCTKPGQLYEAQITYPTIPGRLMSKAHQRTATAYGGWYLFAPFKEIMKMAMYLRKGQQEWVLEQLFRLASNYGVIPA